MSKGSSGTTTVVQDTLPEYAQQYIQNILATAAGGEDGQSGLYTSPYIEYTGPRIAEESPLRDKVNLGIEQLAEVGAPYFGEAMDLQRGIIRSLETPSEFTAETAQKYMNPFLESTLEAQKQEAIADYQQRIPELAKSAVAAGAFGGSRAQLLENQAKENLLDRLAGIESEGRATAYQQAQDLFDVDRRFARDSLLAKEAGLAGLVGLGERGQSSLLERLRQLEGVGKADEARRQSELDLAYDEFTRKRDYPMEQLERFAALVRGMPTPTSRITEKLTQSNPLVDALGLGITGLQLKNLGAFG